MFNTPRLLAYGASLAPFMLGFLLAAMPQLLVNTIQTGQPLYSQQAKNIWLAVYGNIDWGRWNEVPNTIPLSEVVLRAPARFVRNWWHNIIAFLGTGAEETGEFGRAIQLRLLAWPANWLAVCGLAGWLAHILTHMRKKQPDVQQTSTHLAQPDTPAHLAYRPLLLLLFIGLYVAITSLAFVLPRFFLVLAPIYAVAAVTTVRWLVIIVTPPPQDTRRFTRYVVLATLLLLLLLQHGFRIGSNTVLQQQPSDEVAILKLADQTLQPGEKVLVYVPSTVPLHKYSALAHRAIALPDAADAQSTLAQSQHPAIAYLLWDETTGNIPLPVSDDMLVGRAGRYGLYRLAGE